MNGKMDKMKGKKGRDYGLGSKHREIVLFTSHVLMAFISVLDPVSSKALGKGFETLFFKYSKGVFPITFHTHVSSSGRVGGCGRGRRGFWKYPSRGIKAVRSEVISSVFP